ncbi:MAG: hypothetical protein ACRD2T_04420, partial [Thermoanaerobaculia bacterium]
AGGLSEQPERFAEAPVVNDATDLPAAPCVRIEIPRSIQELKHAHPEDAPRWRQSTRRAFQHYLGRGYRVTAFSSDPATGRCFYGLESP